MLVADPDFLPPMDLVIAPNISSPSLFLSVRSLHQEKSSTRNPHRHTWQNPETLSSENQQPEHDPKIMKEQQKTRNRTPTKQIQDQILKYRMQSFSI